MMHSVKVEKDRKTEVYYTGIFGSQRNERQVIGWRVVVQFTSSPASRFESRTFYESQRSAEKAASRLTTPTQVDAVSA